MSLVGRASRLARRTMRQPTHIGGMNHRRGRSRMREDNTRLMREPQQAVWEPTGVGQSAHGEQ